MITGGKIHKGKKKYHMSCQNKVFFQMCLTEICAIFFPSVMVNLI